VIRRSRIARPYNLSSPSADEEPPMSEASQPNDVVTMDKVVSLCRRRGFVFPSSEIYGGLGSSYDYGHYGVLAKNNVKARWMEAMTQERDDIVALDSTIILHPRVWEASGHLQSFSDPLVDCRFCKRRFRADDLEHCECGKKPSKHPGETSDCDLTEPRQFNLMFETTIGPVQESGSKVYLRPETAQGIFINFKNVLQLARRKPPFGIAQIGKSFRNEITPQNFVFRTREFEQMEMEFFVPPAEADEWYQYWVQARYDWYLDFGISRELLRLHEHAKEDLSHYSRGTTDVEFAYPWGWDELEGIANRGDYDLTQHSNASGVKLEYFDQATSERYTPYVIEPAAGATRAMMAFLLAAYHEDEVDGEVRTVLRLDWRLAPYQIAVLPLSKKPELEGVSKEVLAKLQANFMCDYDVTQSIGRRYRRQDEVGTPFCITVDFDTLEDHSVTVRDRDTTEQTRVKIDDLLRELHSRTGQI
jgi:glycyl-tRNA synthetase